jgi:lambda family phage tail tape measure protein
MEGNLHAIQGNPFLTEDEKAKQQIPIYHNELQQVDSGINAQQGIINSTPAGSNANLQAMKDKNQLLVQQIDLENKLKQLESSSSWQGAFNRNLTQLQNNFGNVAVSLTNGAFSMIQRGVEGISGAITGMIMGTETAGQAFAQFGVSMLESFINMIASALIYAYVAIPVLTALGVLTGGATAAGGSVATVAAVTAGISGVGAAMAADGGLITGPGTGTSDSIPARLSNGEFVMRASAVNSIGVDYLHSLNNGIVHRDAAGGSGGFSSGGSTAKNNVSIYPFTDMRQMSDHLERNGDHEKWVVDVMSRHIHQFR